MAERRLSICMIVKNEASNLKELLPSVKTFADEIVIVDTGSEDSTVEVAKEHTPHVYSFSWCDDFSAARNYSLSKASGDYFLWLDADDRVSDKAASHIRELKKYFNGSNFFYMILKDIATTYYGPTTRSYTYQIRCAPLTPDVKFCGRIHERLSNSLSSPPFVAVTTDIEIEHYGYNDPILLRKKMLRNLRLMTMDYEKFKNDPAFNLSLAVTYYALENYSKAYSTIADYIQTNYSDIIENYASSLFELYITASEYAYTSGNNNDAIRWLSKAEACKCFESACIFRLAKAWERLRNHKQAIHYLYASLKAPHRINTMPTHPPPELWEVLLRLAYNYLCLNDPERYEKFILQAIESGNLSRESAYEWLVTHAFYLENLEVARIIMEEAIHNDHATPSILCNLGILHRKLGNITEAEKYFFKTLAINPGHILSLINLGWIYMAKGQYEKSFKAWLDLMDKGIDDWDVIVGGIVSGLLFGADIKKFFEGLKRKSREEGFEAFEGFEIGENPVELTETLLKITHYVNRKNLVPYVAALRRFILKRLKRNADLR